MEAEAKITEQKLTIEAATIKGELAPILYAPSHKQPQREGLRRFVPSGLLLVTVLLPLALALLYNLAIASDRYISSASFVVRSTKGPGQGMLSVLDGGGLTRSDDSSYAVIEFLRSRSVVDKLDRDGLLSRVFGADNVDAFSQFPSTLAGYAPDDLYVHFQKYVDVTFDPASGITTLKVQAFSPRDAHQIAERLLFESEQLVNGMNARAQRDAEEFAIAFVKQAKEELTTAQRRLTEFRNESQILSADTEASMSTGLIANLLEGISTADTEISKVVATSPSNPRLSELRLRREALTQQLEKLRNNLAGNDDSIAVKMEQFDAIALQQSIAQKKLINAESSLLQAKQAAATEKLYIDPIVTPNVPDKYGAPYRLFNVALTLIIGGAIFVIARSLRNLIMEGAR